MDFALCSSFPASNFFFAGDSVTSNRLGSVGIVDIVLITISTAYTKGRGVQEGGQRVCEGNRRKANSTGFKRTERIKNAAEEYGFLERPDQRRLI